MMGMERYEIGQLNPIIFMFLTKKFNSFLTIMLQSNCGNSRMGTFN